MPRPVTPKRRRAPAKSPGATRARDPDATKRRLVDAVGAILARDGFSGMGVNAVAEEARTDKALIYRYFGGLPELLSAYAESTSFWPTVEEMAGGSLEELASLPLHDRWDHALHHYIEQLRIRPITLEILSWELTERDDVTARLEAVREQRGIALMKVLGHDLPPGFDLPAVAGIFAGGIHYLLIRARKIRIFNGIDMRTVEGWSRFEAAAKAMVLGALQHAKHAKR